MQNTFIANSKSLQYILDLKCKILTLPIDTTHSMHSFPENSRY